MYQGFLFSCRHLVHILLYTVPFPTELIPSGLSCPPSRLSRLTRPAIPAHPPGHPGSPARPSPLTIPAIPPGHLSHSAHPARPPGSGLISPTLYYKGCHGTIGRYSPEQAVQARHYVQMYVQFCPHGSGQIKETVKLTIPSCTCYNQVIKRHLGGMERIRREFKTDCISETFAGT